MVTTIPQTLEHPKKRHLEFSEDTQAKFTKTEFGVTQVFICINEIIDVQDTSDETKKYCRVSKRIEDYIEKYNKLMDLRDENPDDCQILNKMYRCCGHILKFDPDQMQCLLNRAALSVLFGKTHCALEDINRLNQFNIKTLVHKYLALAAFAMRKEEDLVERQFEEIFALDYTCAAYIDDNNNYSCSYLIRALFKSEISKFLDQYDDTHKKAFISFFPEDRLDRLSSKEFNFNGHIYECRALQSIDSVEIRGVLMLSRKQIEKNGPWICIIQLLISIKGEKEVENILLRHAEGRAKEWRCTQIRVYFKDKYYAPLDENGVFAAFLISKEYTHDVGVFPRGMFKNLQDFKT